MGRTKKEAYRDWLMSFVGASEEYSLLCDQLLDTDFIYFVGNDVNRAEDGLQLRDEFEEEYGLIRDLMDRPCTLLEMFVALAMRCERDVMYDPNAGNRTNIWFWTMMKNLKLDKCTTKWYKWTTINQILKDFNERNYDFDGQNGGAWVVHHPKEDLKKVELWYQMNWFLVENYDF